MVSVQSGSSPLTRGKLIDWFKSYLLPGLIPAHAGKTPPITRLNSRSGAHPRSRGENIKAAVSVVVEWGSSPLTRGKPATYQVTAKLGGLIPAHAGKTPTEGVLGMDYGLIPAHAGKTSHDQRLATLPRAHPRSRGENTVALKAMYAGDGSSPLTRGKLTGCEDTVLALRLIPAHAGKTAAWLACI